MAASSSSAPAQQAKWADADTSESEERPWRSHKKEPRPWQHEQDSGAQRGKLPSSSGGTSCPNAKSYPNARHDPERWKKHQQKMTDKLKTGRDRNPENWSKEARATYHNERRYHRKDTGFQMAPTYVTDESPQSGVCPPKELIKDLFNYLWEHHLKWRTHKDEDKQWAMMAMLPHQFRRKDIEAAMEATSSTDYYHGWRILTKDTKASWKAKICTEEEFQADKQLKKEALRAIGGRQRQHDLNTIEQEKRAARHGRATLGNKELLKKQRGGERFRDLQAAREGEVKRRKQEGLPQENVNTWWQKAQGNVMYRRHIVRPHGLTEVKRDQSELSESEDDTLALEYAATKWELYLADSLNGTDQPVVNGLSMGKLHEIKNALKTIHWGRGRHRSIDDLEEDIQSAKAYQELYMQNHRNENPTGMEWTAKTEHLDQPWKKMAHVMQEVEKIKRRQQYRKRKAYMAIRHGATQTYVKHEHLSGAQGGKLQRSSEHSGSRVDQLRELHVREEDKQNDEEVILINDDEKHMIKDVQDMIEENNAKMDLGVREDEMNADILSHYKRLGRSRKLIIQTYSNHDDAWLRHAPFPAVPLGMNESPTAFILNSTHPETAVQTQQTSDDLRSMGFTPYIIPGIDGTLAMTGDHTWRRAAVTWGLVGMPFIEKCVELNYDFLDDDELSKRWYVICEDSAMPLIRRNLISVQKAVTRVERGVEIIQAGYRFQVQKGHKSHKLNLHTMTPTEEGTHITRACGQKMLIATYKGINLIKDRLLKGEAAFYDHCIADLQRSGIVHLMQKPICGSRHHFSLVSHNKGKWVGEERATGD